MHAVPKRAISVARRFGLGRGVAALELRAAPIVWARTRLGGHVTVWAHAETLLEAVVHVTDVSKNQYTLLDRASRNFLGWFDTLAEAEETRDRFVAAAPEAAADLEIWDDRSGIQIELEADKQRPGATPQLLTRDPRADRAFSSSD